MERVEGERSKIAKDVQTKAVVKTRRVLWQDECGGNVGWPLEVGSENTLLTSDFQGGLVFIGLK